MYGMKKEQAKETVVCEVVCERLQRSDKQERMCIPTEYTGTNKLRTQGSAELVPDHQHMPQLQQLLVPLEAHPAGCHVCRVYRIICLSHEMRLFRVFLNTHPEPLLYQHDSASKPSVRVGLSTIATTTEPWNFCTHTSGWSLWGNNSKYCVLSHFLKKCILMNISYDSTSFNSVSYWCLKIFSFLCILHVFVA